MSTQINHSIKEEISDNISSLQGNVNISKTNSLNFEYNNVFFEYNSVNDNFGYILNVLLSFKTSNDTKITTKPSKELIKIICTILKETLPSSKILIVLPKITDKIIQLCTENSISLLDITHFIKTFYLLQLERDVYPEEIFTRFLLDFSIQNAKFDNNFKLIIKDIPKNIVFENDLDNILNKLLNDKTEKRDIDEEIIKLDPSALLPERGTKYSACCDLFSPIDTVIPANSNKLIKTNLAITWNNPNYYMQLLSRSGNAYKKNLIVQAGVIDIDYRMGNIGVLLQNNSNVDVEVKRGMAIAQYAYFRIAKVSSSEVKEFSFELESNRNGGFGSTDKV